MRSFASLRMTGIRVQDDTIQGHYKGAESHRRVSDRCTSEVQGLIDTDGMPFGEEFG